MLRSMADNTKKEDKFHSFEEWGPLQLDQKDLTQRPKHFLRRRHVVDAKIKVPIKCLLKLGLGFDLCDTL